MFQKSSRCKADSPMCVEVDLEAGDIPKVVEVRNSRDRRKTIKFTREEWTEFIDAVKRGEFDLRTDYDMLTLEQLEQV